MCRLSGYGLLFVLWRTGIVAVAITPGDFAVLVMDHELRALISAYLPAPINRVLLTVEVGRRAATAPPLYVPPPLRIWYYMMGLPGHNVHLLLEGPFFLTI